MSSVTTCTSGGVGAGVPGGGNTGEVLAKKSDTSFDTEWVFNQAAGIPEAPADGAGYLRQGSTNSWIAGLPLSGGTMTGTLIIGGGAQISLNAGSTFKSFSGSSISIDNSTDWRNAIAAAPATVIPDYLVPQELPENGTPGDYGYDPLAGVNATLTLTQNSVLVFVTGQGAMSGTLVVTQGAGGWSVQLPAEFVTMAGDAADIAGAADGKRAVIAWTTMDGLTFFCWITIEP